MTIFSWINRVILGNKPKVVKVQIDPESVRDNHRIKVLAYENAELKGKMAKLQNRLAQLSDREKEQEEEENIKTALNEEREDLRKKHKGKVLSLTKIYNKLKKADFKEKLGIFAFDRSTKLAKFGDFGINEDGAFCILDSEGNIILGREKLRDIFQSCGAIGNDLAKGQIVVNLDKDGGYVPNIIMYDLPEIIPLEDGNFKYTTAKMKPLYEMVEGLHNDNYELHAKLEEEEAMNIELQKKIDHLSSVNKLNDSIAETSRAELSHTEERVLGIDKAFRMLKRDLYNSQNVGIIQEDNLQKLESALDEMRSKAERQGVKLSDEKALELINNIRSTLANEIPDVKEEKVEEPIKK